MADSVKCFEVVRTKILPLMNKRYRKILLKILDENDGDSVDFFHDLVHSSCLKLYEKIKSGLLMLEFSKDEAKAKDYIEKVRLLYQDSQVLIEKSKEEEMGAVTLANLIFEVQLCKHQMISLSYL